MTSNSYCRQGAGKVPNLCVHPSQRSGLTASPCPHSCASTEVQLLYSYPRPALAHCQWQITLEMHCFIVLETRTPKSRCHRLTPLGGSDVWSVDASLIVSGGSWQSLGPLEFLCWVTAVSAHIFTSPSFLCLSITKTFVVGFMVHLVYGCLRHPYLMTPAETLTAHSEHRSHSESLGEHIFGGPLSSCHSH